MSLMCGRNTGRHLNSCVVLATVLVYWGCGSSSPATSQSGAGGQAASSGGMLSSTVPASGGAGGSASSSNSSTTNGGSTATSVPLVDPEADVPCEQEPQDGTWSDLQLNASTQCQLALGASRAVLICISNNQLMARVSDDSGKSWSDAVRIDSDGSKVDPLGIRVVMSPDGSSAIAYWQSAGGYRWVNRYTPSIRWGAPVQITPADPGGATDPFPDDELVVLSNGKAVLAHQVDGSPMSVQYRLFDGTSWGDTKSLQNTAFVGLFLGLNELPTLFTEEADPNRISVARHTLDFASGWSAPEFNPNPAPTSAYQVTAFEGVRGHAARIFRVLGSDAAIWISARENATWGSDERLGATSTNMLDMPRAAEVGDELLVAWNVPPTDSADETELLLVERSTGKAWTTVKLARSNNLTGLTLAGSSTGAAVLSGYVDRWPAASLTKIFRRSSSGVWYCPRLKQGPGNTVAAANADGVLLVAVRGESNSSTVMRFEPK